MMTEEERNTIISIRLQRAKETLLEVKEILKLGYWRTAANRLYYACYYVSSALLIKKGNVAHTHSGVINQIGLHFVQTGIISKEFGKFYANLFELRQTSDYGDWRIIEEADVQPLIAPAEEYICFLEQLIMQKE
ncbi:HEPN domain-containing protein [Candidatus Symbiothrix dinenymphae]|uniref:HEPN domain-containing protein n=1 Tax=Candidatus Symbiothrix dinenymphae TaxID=467085 RepID=UPI0006C63BAC|nr:HEPN domain-containing protein [Candidatus Symbiothrix dinenymphae]GAP72180.1 hypothetical protein SAMD00024442_26_31 [Candidatus Symbiothrix dinenymphae]